LDKRSNGICDLHFIDRQSQYLEHHHSTRHMTPLISRRRHNPKFCYPFVIMKRKAINRALLNSAQYLSDRALNGFGQFLIAALSGSHFSIPVVYRQRQSLTRKHGKHTCS
jgi:hypothetical protein